MLAWQYVWNTLLAVFEKHSSVEISSLNTKITKKLLVWMSKQSHPKIGHQNYSTVSTTCPKVDRQVPVNQHESGRSTPILENCLTLIRRYSGYFPGAVALSTKPWSRHFHLSLSLEEAAFATGGWQNKCVLMDPLERPPASSVCPWLLWTLHRLRVLRQQVAPRGSMGHPGVYFPPLASVEHLGKPAALPVSCFIAVEISGLLE